MAEFKVGDREFETTPLRGRQGRAVTNYLLKKAGQGDMEAVIDILEDKMFLDKHLPVILGPEDAKYVDDNATTGELLNMVTAIVDEMTENMGDREVGAALKNSPGSPGAGG